jgi:hypothetical protein
VNLQILENLLAANASKCFSRKAKELEFHQLELCDMGTGIPPPDRVPIVHYRANDLFIKHNYGILRCGLLLHGRV